VESLRDVSNSLGELGIFSCKRAFSFLGTFCWLPVKENSKKTGERQMLPLPLHELARSVRNSGAGTGTGTGLSHCKKRNKNFFIFFRIWVKKLARAVLCGQFGHRFPPSPRQACARRSIPTSIVGIVYRPTGK
jgi:hypothetical protein